VSPFPEDDPVPLIESIGVERVVFGSDYPHPEGLAEPGDYRKRLAALDAASQQRILRDNAWALLGEEKRS
jgi:predicted TIM-barrel fold metal-dependent hydrolase